MGRRAWQPGRAHQIGQRRGGAHGDDVEEQHRPVDRLHASCAVRYAIHEAILASHIVRLEPGRSAMVETTRMTPLMTMSEKVWERHVVHRAEGEPDLLYVDLHLVHEVTSPQAFDGLREAGRPVRRPDLTVATEDHNTPTLNIDQPIADPVSRTQVDTLRANAAEFGVRIHSLGDLDQ